MPLFGGDGRAYVPRRVARFAPCRIVLTRGSLTTPGRRSLVESICAIYPQAEVVEQLDRAHTQVDLGATDPLALHYRGKRTLVFGEHKSAVRFSAEQGNTCPNYWHFSPYGFCPYDCKYCYLAATRGVWFSPTVKVFMNLPEILGKIDRVSSGLREPTAFFLGKLQDALALDPLTGYSRVMVPFFAARHRARMTLLTKADDVANLLDLDHGGRTILAWSLNPPPVCERYEGNTPPPRARIKAMRRCAAAGYPVRANLMPIIPVEGWRDVYADFLVELLAQVPLERITLGGTCIYPDALRLMVSKLGADNAISRSLPKRGVRSPDGRSRYALADRVEIYRYLIATIRRLRPGLHIGLCLEDRRVFEALDLTASLGRCTCPL